MDPVTSPLPPARVGLALAAFALATCALSCGPTQVGTVGDAETGAPTVGTDGSDGSDGSDGTSGDDDGVEVLPGGRATAVLSPPAGTFVGSVDVEVTSSSGSGVVMACVTEPARGCTPEPLTGTLSLDRSAVVLTQVDNGAIRGDVEAWSYVQVEPELADFDSNLPVMVAWTDATFDALVENTAVGLTVIAPDGDRAALLGPAADSARARLRVRGSSSASLDKKNFDLELWSAVGEDDRPAPLLDLPAEADWVMHAPSYFDDALVRNALGYQLSRDIGQYAPRTAFFELFVATRGRPVSAGAYAGVYVLVEEIEGGADRVDVASLDPDDLTAPDITGGYVFKRDRSGSSAEELWVGSGDGAFIFAAPIVPVDPEIDDLASAQVAYLASEIDSLGRALAAGGVDPASGRAVEDLADIDAFIDLHILNALFKNPDAFRLSAYFHKDREGPIRAGPLWDLDRTAGSIDSRARDPYHWDATNFTADTTPLFTYGWYGALFADAAFRDRYWARWQELLAGPLALDAILAHIDAMEAQLAEAGPRNAERWGAAPLSDEMDALRAWFVARHAWIAACIDTAEDPRTCAG